MRLSALLKMNMTGASFRIGVASGGTNVVQFGYNTVANSVVCSTPYTGETTSSVSLASSTYYRFEIIADNDTNMADCFVYTTGGSQLSHVTKQIYGSPSALYYDRAIVSKTQFIAGFTGWVDDFKVIKK